MKFILFACILATITANAQDMKPCDYVNPMTGTGGHGHTYPGATVPFGLVQLSPDTRLDGWDGCSGYHYSDSIIYGFSHTHLNGTGCSDYGDILLMPATGEPILNNGADGKPGYCSSFKHSSEHAEPGYYSVFLDNPGIKAELTASSRVGFHCYTFPESSQANIIIDLVHRDDVIASSLNVISDTEIEGMRRSKAWAQDQHVYFVARFSKPFSSFSIAANDILQNDLENASGKHLKAFFQFSTHSGEKILVKVGISSVSTDGARKNLGSEMPGWDFKKAHAEANDNWNQALGRIEISGGSKDQKSVFYTALYHTMINPVLAGDVDGNYRGRDLKIHKAEGYDQYTVFSLWDTYRAYHPLMTIIDQKRTNDFIKTFLAQYDQGGLLPVWELSGNETNCMIGYHSVSVIADAFIKGIRGFDAGKALEAMKKSANQDKSGLSYYKKQGFVPSEREHESVSKTLEYAYDDWCIAQMAMAMGKTDDYSEFIKRGQNYKNVFDPHTGFMRARFNGGWYSPFIPAEVNNNYTEANSWQYSFACPQDIDCLIKLHGGKDKLSARLDALYTADTRTSGREQSDITGLIGQYAHGNEPSHHLAYLYNYTGKPEKTQALVHKIMNEFYTPKPDGLIGNEDCGQMSAWAVLGAMGFYPVTPGNDIYTIGTPMFGKAIIHLENGNQFVIKADNLSQDNYYIQSAKLNGKEYLKSFLKHGNIMQGGELVFEMGPLPSETWGKGEGNEPSTAISDFPILPAPYLSEGSHTFAQSTTVKLSATNDAIIYYTISDSSGTSSEAVYTKPFTIDDNCKLNFYAAKAGFDPSPVITSEFLKIKSDKIIRLNTQPALQYSGDGASMLTDGIRGNEDFRLGGWQGYEAVNVDAIVDLKHPKIISRISIGFLQDINSWIFMPAEIGFFLSDDGINFNPAGNIKNNIPQDNWDKIFKDFTLNIKPEQTRYIRVVAKNIGACPPGHKGNGAPSWIFTDEIIVE